MTRRRRPPWGIVRNVGRRLGPSFRCQEVVETIRNVRRRGDDRLNLGQRVVAGNHLGDDPLVRSVDRTLSKSRDEAGRDDARFARSRRADQRHEVRLVAQRAEQLRHKVFAPEEVGSVALAERAEALVRVAGCRGGRCRGVGQHEGWIVEEDPLLEPLERGRRLQPELLVEHGPQVLVGPESLGMPAGPVQGEHQQLAGALAQGLRGSPRRAAARRRPRARRRDRRQPAPRSRRGTGRASDECMAGRTPRR